MRLKMPDGQIVDTELEDELRACMAHGAVPVADEVETADASAEGVETRSSRSWGRLRRP
jgi:hypothetical protein